MNQKFALMWPGAAALALMFALAWSATAQQSQAPPRDPAPVPITRSTFTELAKQVIPSVVTVYVRRDVTQRMSPEQRRQFEEFRRFFSDPELRQFFPFTIPEQEEKMVIQGAGSGVIVSDDGYIVTNAHVVGAKKDRAEIRVVFSDDEELSGEDVELLDSSELIDLALLKVNRRGLKPIRIGDSDRVQIGEWVAAIGSPLELKQTMTQGIISAKHRDVGAGLGDMIQTDAAINPGSSGGALVNLDGELIGLNRMIASPGGTQWAGYGFAIPSAQVQFFIEQVRKDGEIVYGYIGVMLGAQKQMASILKALGIDEKAQGVLIMSVTPNGPAAKAGLQEGDFIVSVDDRKVTDSGDMTSYVARRPVGSMITVTFLRPRKGAAPTRETARIQVARRPTEAQLGAQPTPEPYDEEQQGPDFAESQIGVQVEPYRDQQNRGVRVVRVQPGSRAAKAGLRPGDVLLKYNWIDLKNPRDLERAVREAPKDRPAPAFVMRGGQRVLVPIE